MNKLKNIEVKKRYCTIDIKMIFYDCDSMIEVDEAESVAFIKEAETNRIIRFWNDSVIASWSYHPDQFSWNCRSDSSARYWR